MRLQSLRTKLAVANVLPILLLMPILSLYLLSTLEEFYTQKLLQQLEQQGLLIFDRVQEDPGLVEDAAAAQAFLAEIAHNTDARVLLLSTEETILGSTRSADSDHIGGPYLASEVNEHLPGAPTQGADQGLAGEAAYVSMPISQNGSFRGLLRLSYEMDDVQAQFDQLRWLVIFGVGVTALLGLALGIELATTITRPLNQLTRRVQEIANGQYAVRAGINRQDEIGILAGSFNQMATKLEEADSARQQQLAAIVHELARPLTGMSAAVEALLDDSVADVDVQHELMVGIGEEIARLGRLVGTLQHIQKQILQPLQLQCTPVLLQHVIGATIANFKPIATQLGITLSAQVSAELPPIHADQDRLIQVLTNLLDNALKFTARGGHIRVEANPKADAVFICVTDTGVGIAPDELPHIFQQFYNGTDAHPPEKRGMGLGLTLCHQIVTAHRGKIWAESEVGGGSRFTFTIPYSSSLCTDENGV
jgi:signal transduction histidine kinase